MTQHNAALVEETNAAIEQTEAQAVELDRVVDVFHLGSGEPAVAAPVTRREIRAAPARAGRSARIVAAAGNAAVDWTEF
jgi:methyl-accepting chemotaxis protein